LERQKITKTGESGAQRTKEQRQNKVEK